mmetsp:Transcript_19529/g.48946  ORF Transcript_19529/g.48946 Transcript_19529/m.48946 type:complete len:106 (+) Transcript_19529:146-463(+)
MQLSPGAKACSAAAEGADKEEIAKVTVLRCFEEGLKRGWGEGCCGRVVERVSDALSLASVAAAASGPESAAALAAAAEGVLAVPVASVPDRSLHAVVVAGAPDVA